MKRKRNQRGKGKGRNHPTNKKPVTEQDLPYNRIVFVKEPNDSFKSYYSKIIPSDQWDSFISTMQLDLSTTFRISSTSVFGEALIAQMEIMSSTFGDTECEDITYKAPYTIDWYPHPSKAWKWDLTGRLLRKCANGKSFHEVVKVFMAVGTLTRQEEVSMLPPLFADIQPHHIVLDLCAAPGSKTMQVVDYLHAGGKSTGMLVANDIDKKRCFTLVTQIGRNSNNENVIVTNHNAAMFPNIFFEENGKMKKIKYDRIICDVPCSGDGTLRKNADIWSSWNPNSSLSQHSIQLACTRRSLHMLKVGGVMVYSTCSMSPIENEAVICDILNYSKGSLRLVDVSQRLTIKTSPGLSKWTVMDNELNHYENHADLPSDLQTKFPESVFPTDNIDSLNIQYCMRLLPHDNNTGGFFIAVLEKVTKFSKTANHEKSISDESPLLCPLNDEMTTFVTNTLNIMGIDLADFPIDECFFMKSEKDRKIFYLSEELRKLNNGTNSKLKVISIGERAFDYIPHGKSNSTLRICDEILPLLLPHVTKRIVDCTLEDIIKLFSEQAIKTNICSTLLIANVEPLEQGPCVFHFISNDDYLLDYHVPGWIGSETLSIFVKKEKRTHFLNILSMIK